MWCRTVLGPDQAQRSPVAGTTYPANNYAAYPYAIAAGPVGSIWFGRYFGGTIFTSPDDGEVGFLDAGSSAVTAFNTGERTAPNSLIQGPDGNMWFTSIGAAKGIGHIAPNGTGGALTAIGNYAPNSIAFGTDGAVYATDGTNNVIIKTTIADLQVTNVDPGDGSVLYGGPAAASRSRSARSRSWSSRTASRSSSACPKTAAKGCTGTARLLTNAKKKPKAVSSAAKFKLKPGKKETLQFKLSKKGLAGGQEGQGDQAEGGHLRQGQQGAGRRPGHQGPPPLTDPGRDDGRRAVVPADLAATGGGGDGGEAVCPGHQSAQDAAGQHRGVAGPERLGPTLDVEHGAAGGERPEHLVVEGVHRALGAGRHLDQPQPGGSAALRGRGEGGHRAVRRGWTCAATRRGRRGSSLLLRWTTWLTDQKTTTLTIMVASPPGC